MPKSVKLKLKGGGYVDPESGLEDKVSKRYVPQAEAEGWRLCGPRVRPRGQGKQVFYFCLRTGVFGIQHVLIIQVKETLHEKISFYKDTEAFGGFVDQKL
jgi:hypothetical protein